jgi:uncharacterized phage protein gp47/JayE
LADTREGSYTNDLVSAVALELWKFYNSLNALIPIVYVDETSGEYIDKRAAYYGIIRKPGTKATTILTFTGTDGTVIPKDTVFLTADGLQFVTTETATIANGTASVTASAAEVGEVYNVPAGTITQQIISISGLSTVTNTAAIGGTDPESDASLVARLYNYLQKPASSGNIYHYEQWALEVDGVGAVKVVPLWNGPGTVKVIIAGPDKGPVDAAVVANCAEHIESCRPIGATVTVVSAQSLPIDVSATVELESTTTKDIVQEAFTERLAEYLRNIAFDKYEVVYNRIAYMLLDIDGVIDYSSLTVNGGTANITIGADQVPVAGTVVINIASN